MSARSLHRDKLPDQRADGPGTASDDDGGLSIDGRSWAVDIHAAAHSVK